MATAPKVTESFLRQDLENILNAAKQACREIGVVGNTLVSQADSLINKVKDPNINIEATRQEILVAFQSAYLLPPLPGQPKLSDKLNEKFHSVDMRQYAYLKTETSKTLLSPGEAPGATFEVADAPPPGTSTSTGNPQLDNLKQGFENWWNTNPLQAGSLGGAAAAFITAFLMTKGNVSGSIGFALIIGLLLYASGIMAQGHNQQQTPEQKAKDEARKGVNPTEVPDITDDAPWLTNALGT